MEVAKQGPPPGGTLYMITAKKANLSALAQAAKARASKDVAPPPAPAAKATFSAIAARKTSVPRAQSDEDLIMDVIVHLLEVEPKNVLCAQWPSPSGPLFLHTTPNEALFPSHEEGRWCGEARIEHATRDQYMEIIGDHTPRSRLMYTIVVEHNKTAGVPTDVAHTAVGTYAATLLRADPKLSDLRITDIRYNALRKRPLTILYMHGPLQTADMNGTLKSLLDKKIGYKGGRAMRATWRPETEGFYGDYEADLLIKAYGRMFFTAAEAQFLRGAFAGAPPHRLIAQRGGDSRRYVAHDLAHIPTATARDTQGKSLAPKPTPSDDADAHQHGKNVRVTENRVADGVAPPSAKPKTAGARQVQTKDRPPFSSQEPAGSGQGTSVALGKDAGSTVATRTDPDEPTPDAGEMEVEHTGGPCPPAGTALVPPPDHTSHPPRQSEDEGEGGPTRDRDTEADAKGTAPPLEGKGGHTESGWACISGCCPTPATPVGRDAAQWNVVPGRTTVTPATTEPSRQNSAHALQQDTDTQASREGGAWQTVSAARKRRKPHREESLPAPETEQPIKRQRKLDGKTKQAAVKALEARKGSDQGADASASGSASDNDLGSGSDHDVEMISEEPPHRHTNNHTARRDASDVHPASQ